MQPLVSILIPAYNAERWIAGAIRSALAQTWQRSEIVIVDDGSTDRTLEVVKTFTARNVRLISQTNQGASVARNTAFSHCQGDYIQWLDADDLLAPDKVARQMAWADRVGPRTLLSGAWAYFIYRPQAARFAPSALWADASPLDWLDRKMRLNLHMQTDNWLISRELSDRAGPWDSRLWRDNDGEYLCRVILASDGIKFVPEARSFYRSAGFDSISYIGGSNRKLESLLLSMRLHVGYLLSLEDSDRTRSACLSYLRNWQGEFYPYRPDLVEQLHALAADLGGDLPAPRLSWKYQWLVNCVGPSAGKRAQVFLQRSKRSLVINWDRLLYRLGSGELPT
jgi:glycosyltransferase involved in cell wall biosynthesis